MTRALIGHTGFVGGTILRQATFDATYNSTNIEQIARRRYDLVVCAGAPGRKWHANQNPEGDLASIQRLMASLEQVDARELVLISTIDVYPEPQGVDEETAIDNARNSPYGRHRRLLEEFVLARFSGRVIRLPGLFGQGLKKNIIYDFLHGNHVDLISPDSVFQFYDMSNLWSDIGRFRESGPSVINVATEPISVRAVARDAFGFEFRNPSAPPPVRYDVRTRFSSLYGRHAHYLYELAQVIDGLRRFIQDERTK